MKAPVARSTCFINIWTIASSRRTVLPEPVGALTTNERAEERMKSSISAWMPLKYLKDEKMGWKHGGSSSTERTRSRESFGGERRGGGGAGGGAEGGGAGARGRGARRGGGAPPLTKSASHGRLPMLPADTERDSRRAGRSEVAKADSCELFSRR